MGPSLRISPTVLALSSGAPDLIELEEQLVAALEAIFSAIRARARPGTLSIVLQKRASSETFLCLPEFLVIAKGIYPKLNPMQTTLDAIIKNR